LQELFDLANSVWFHKGEEGVVLIENILKKEELLEGLTFQTEFENEDEEGTDPNFYITPPEDIQEVVITEDSPLNYLFVDKITFFNDYQNNIAYAYK
jgi:hypothetical protein